jgi:outer membrane lipoprotein-sorting protein
MLSVSRHQPSWSNARFVAACAMLLIAGVSANPVQADEAAAKEHPLKPAIRYANECLARINEVPGYQASFFKREVVGNTMVTQTAIIKIRHEPFSVYLFFQNPHEGREVIYVDGKNRGNLLAHEAGLASLVGTLELAPNSTQAMSENRYPITMAGIANLAKAVVAQWEEETAFGEIDVKYYKNAKLGEMTCRVIESSHPQPRKQFKFHKTRLWIDTATGFPVKVEQFGFPRVAGAKPPIVEEYRFTDIKTDVRLTDQDFDPRNPRYNF